MSEDRDGECAGIHGDGREPAGATPKRRRPPRRITRQYLENVALWYLGRFAATSKGLESVLMRRVQRAARHYGSEPAEGAALVAALIARYREAGLLNDTAFAEARARTLHERGLALRTIAQKLRQKGVSADDIDAAVAALAERTAPEEGSTARDLDRAAARTYARRRRLGPWRKGGQRTEMRERDLAALARAGFSYGIAREVVDGAADEG